MVLIQLMLFMESIRLELEKLGFKLIIELVVIFNYIIWIDIHFILIDAISWCNLVFNCKNYSIDKL